MSIIGVRALLMNSASDSRGHFVKTFSTERESRLPTVSVAETFYSTTFKGAARGMHLQIGEGASNRIITCIKGQIFDILIDLRSNSDSFLQIDTITMGPSEINSIFVPQGVAHGFVALEESVTHYISDKIHKPELDTGIHMNSIDVDYPFKNFILSERDQGLPALNEWLKRTV
jgi:hypothetical protein